MAAAIAAARAGTPVVLVERESDVGGTMADSLLHTLAGLYDSRGEFVNTGLPVELVNRLQAADASVHRRRMGKVWVLSVDPNVYRDVVRSWLLNESAISLLVQTKVSRVTVVGSTVTDVELCGPAGTFRMPVQALVDATGSAAIVSLIAPQL